MQIFNFLLFKVPQLHVSTIRSSGWVLTLSLLIASNEIEKHDIWTRCPVWHSASTTPASRHGCFIINSDLGPFFLRNSRIPAGMLHNSPAIHCWVSSIKDFQSRQGLFKDNAYTA